MLTERQRLDYIMGGIDTCPQCGGCDTSGSDWDYDGDIVWQNRTCMDCDCAHTITWSLSDVQTQPGANVALEPNSATARELRTALERLLTVFDELGAQGEMGWETRAEVRDARSALGKGFVPPLTPSSENETIG